MADFDYRKIHAEFKAVLRKIKQYDRIVVYRHQIPDYDAFGSQMGLVTWIRDNFPRKEVRFFGDANERWCPNLYPQPEPEDATWFAKGPYLAISVDVADTKRLAGTGYGEADYRIKIDHHPNVEAYGDLNIVYPEVVACAALVALFVLAQPKRLKVSPATARYLFSGIVGDSGRFLYPGTDPAVLRIAADLLATGFDLEGLYDLMYAKTMADIETQKFVLNATKVTPGGVAYYVINDADLKRLKLTPGEGKIFVNLFRGVAGITATVSVTQDIAADCFRVSLRSNRKVVNQVAQKYRGGGHEFAAGATLSSLDELPWLLKDLDEAPEGR